MSNKRICAYVKLESVKKNIDAIKRNMRNGTKIMAMVPCNAYGHGAVQISKYIENAVYAFGVSNVSEALELRAANIKRPILVIGNIYFDEIIDVIKNDISITVNSYRDAFEISKVAAKAAKTIRIHILFDTGLGNYGFDCSQRAIDDVARISKLPGLSIEGVYSQFANSDRADKTYTKAQFEKFLEVTEALTLKGVNIGLRHIADSAAVIDMSGLELDMVRLGGAMYGICPSAEVSKSNIALTQAMSLESHISAVRDIPKGETLGQGSSFVTERNSTIATLPVGFGDGISSYLSGKMKVLIGDVYYPVVGQISIDYMLVDVTGSTVNVGDRVVIVGKDRMNSITVEEIAALSGLKNYEFTTGLSSRVPRCF